jgi:hypothetical protein
MNLLIKDGGTAGYLGQVSTIKKGLTECYECNPKVTNKTFAGKNQQLKKSMYNQK